jgi:hypothetical protein
MQTVLMSQAIVTQPIWSVLLVLQIPIALEQAKDAPLLEATLENASLALHVPMLTLQDSVKPTFTATPRLPLLELILLPALLTAPMMLLALTPQCITQGTSAKLHRTLAIPSVLQSVLVVNAPTLL